MLAICQPVLVWKGFSSQVTCAPKVSCQSRRRLRHERQIRDVHVCRASEPTSTSDSPGVPWNFGFQMNERYINWDEAASKQLVRRVLAQKLDTTNEDVERRLEELATLVPDMVGKLERTRADILYSLLSNMPAVAMKLLAYKDLLPGVNVSLLASRYPSLLIDWDIKQLDQRLQELRSELPGVMVERLIDAEPMLLHADISTVLANIRRIMPGQDPVRVLVTQPQMVLDMNSAGMPSAADVEGPVQWTP